MFNILFSNDADRLEQALVEYIDQRIADAECFGVDWDYGRLVQDFVDSVRCREVEEFRRLLEVGENKAEKHHSLCSCEQCLEENLSRLFDSQDAHAGRN